VEWKVPRRFFVRERGGVRGRVIGIGRGEVRRERVMR
jgi:hypothetical protein